MVGLDLLEHLLALPDRQKPARQRDGTALRRVGDDLDRSLQLLIEGELDQGGHVQCLAGAFGSKAGRQLDPLRTGAAGVG